MVLLSFKNVLIAAIALKPDCRVYTLDERFSTLARHSGVRLYTPGVGGTFVHDHPLP